MSQGSGKHGSRSEVERRVTEVYKWINAGIGYQEILRLGNGKRGWDVSTRSIDSYIAKARKRLERDSRAIREVELGKAVNRLDTQYFKADSRGDHRGAVIAERAHIDLFGLAAPQRLEVTLETIDAEIARREIELSRKEAAQSVRAKDAAGG